MSRLLRSRSPGAILRVVAIVAWIESGAKNECALRATPDDSNALDGREADKEGLVWNSEPAD